MAACVLGSAQIRVESPDGDVWVFSGDYKRAPDPTAAPFETSVPGIFAVGDVRANSVKRVASAVGEGSVAIAGVHQYLAATPLPTNLPQETPA